MSRLESWEFFGLILAAGAAVFAVAYAGPGAASLSLTGRAIEFRPAPDAALGLAALALTAFASITGIIVGQLKPAVNNIGAPLLVWTDVIVLVVGDVLFYSGDSESTVILLIGLSSAVLMVIGLGVIARRPLRISNPTS